MINTKYLYYFSGPTFELVEVQRMDKEYENLSDKFKWLVFHKNSNSIWELDFESMNSGSVSQTRKFVEGELTFDKDQAVLTLFSEQFSLKALPVDKVPHTLDSRINQFLEDNLHSNTFYLRPLKPSDLNHFKKWVFDPEVIRYSMTKFHRIKSVEEVTRWFHSTLSDIKTFQYAIVDSDSKQIIGYSGIAGINEVDRNGEYFIFIGDKNSWGKGIASQVTKKIIKLGFENLGLHRIFLTASSKNTGALKAYERAGFIHEGNMREAFFRDNEFSDKIIMGILKLDWEQGLKHE